MGGKKISRGKLTKQSGKKETADIVVDDSNEVVFESHTVCAKFEHTITTTTTVVVCFFLLI